MDPLSSMQTAHSSMDDIADRLMYLAMELNTMCKRMSENRIPDIIKSLPVYDGETIPLKYWLCIAEKRLKFFESRVDREMFDMYTSAVIDKIQGEPMNILLYRTNLNEKAISFNEVKQILLKELSGRTGFALPRHMIQWELK